jgi:hypothetical protein
VEQIVAALVLVVLLVALWRGAPGAGRALLALIARRRPPSAPPSMPDVAEDPARPRPDAQWNDDPEAGAVVTPNTDPEEPGGA